MKAPPEYAIEAARLAAESPCAKSKRGVVLFDGEDDAERIVCIAGKGFNGPPAGFVCGNNESCRASCAKLCLHAEERAIREALVEWGDPAGLQLLHVKVENGDIVPGGGPSCWQCSRLVVDVGLRGVWLLEADVSKCLACKRFEDSSAKREERNKRCPECSATLTEIGRWRFYTAADFHHETLRACGIEVSP